MAVDRAGNRFSWISRAVGKEKLGGTTQPVVRENKKGEEGKN